METREGGFCKSSRRYKYLVDLTELEFDLIRQANGGQPSDVRRWIDQTLSEASEDVVLYDEDLEEDEPRKCRVCGCTDADCSGCIERTGKPCHWIERDLCSACEGKG